MEAIKPSEDLYVQQAELEQQMTITGIEMFRESNRKAVEKGNEAGTVYGKTIINHLLPKVTEALKAYIAQRESGKAGKKGAAYPYLKMMEDRLDAVAYISLVLVVSGISTPRGRRYNRLAVSIGRAIENEHHYGKVRETDRKFYMRLRDEAKKRSSNRVKEKVVNYYLNKNDMGKTEEWPEADVAVLGGTVLEALIAADLVTKETISSSGRKADLEVVLQATERTLKLINDRSESAQALRPFYEPMIVPPLEWTAPNKGGYLTDRVRPVNLVKAHKRSYLESLAGLEMDEVYGSVNAAQATAWTINPFILTVLNIAWEQDHSIGDIPSKFSVPIPPKPYDIDTNEVSRKEWRQKAASVHQQNLELDGKRIAFTMNLNTANRYSLFDKLYMPYQLDFRGRIYAVPRLNPQGPDWMKALLMFSEGKPIDEESAPFLAIQVANTGAFNKIDKDPLEDRVQWVYENEDKILACAADPFENRWWTEADSPYCFLAACYEWAGYLREGTGFVSHLPVALDGSCSGIQHFSMALRDEVGGAAVNLVPSDRPADIYSLVMEKAVAQVCLDISTCGDKSEIAKQWQRSDLLSRSCFKRPTMTYGYGSGQFGFRDQIMTDTLKPALRAFEKGEGPWYFEGNGYDASLYLSQVTIKAVEQTVLKAAEAMKWLKEAASVVTAEGLAVRWTTPDGFPVMQHYQQQKSHRVDTMIFGSRVTMSLKKDVMDEKQRPKVDRRKQASGLSPNFVHSLDATHLRMAVLQAYREGIADVALVHDSFGTHAADTGRFFTILREAMVDLYTNCDVFEDFRAQLTAQLGPKNKDKMPPLPEKGSLDIQGVLESDFAFA